MSASADKTTASRKKKALLASGTVLGVGAVITLAAWNDSVWGEGTFGTGENTWNIEGSFDGGTVWDEFVTQGTAGTMNFNSIALDLAPGESTYALVGLREEFGNDGADVVVAPPVTGGNTALAGALRVTIRDLGVGTTAPAYSGTEGTAILTNQPLNGSTASSTVTITPGGYRWIGFTVTLPADTNPSGIGNTTTTAAWEMQATSTP